MSNPFLDRLAKQGQTGHGRSSEKRVAKSMGARIHPASGAMNGAKSDASMTEENFRLEMKSTTNDTMRLEMAWLVKIAREALPYGQQPALVVSFVDAEGKPRMKTYGEWVMIPKAVFEELTTK